MSKKIYRVCSAGSANIKTSSVVKYFKFPCNLIENSSD